MKDKPEFDTKMFNENIRNEIISENKFQRKKALEYIIREVKNETNDQAMCQKVFNEYQVYILKCFRDESEMCRELAMDLMWSIIQRLNLNDYYLTYIFPVIVERIGTPEIVEDSEELRLHSIRFMIDIIKMYAKTEYLVPFFNDIIIILTYSLLDKHPKVKQSCCECIIETANALPKHFHMQCENLLTPLIKSFTHQHFRIRVIAVQAVGTIIMHGSFKALESTITPLAERLFDQIPQVRRAVIQVSANLLLEYKDRYSYFHKILPLILTGLSDEVPDTRNYAEELWVKVGLQYQDENEKDLKDQLDFTENLPIVTKYPRPNIGCRTLVQRNTTRIVAALCRELSTTWQDDIKLRCGQLLTSLILHAEASFTQNLQDAFPAMFSICRQNDDGSQSVIKAAELIGVFIPPQTWFKFISDILSSTVNCGHLRVIKAIMTGCTAENLTSLCDELAVLFSARHVCHVRGNAYQKELIGCSVLLATCEKFLKNEVCVTSLAVLALGDGKDQSTRDVAEELVEKCWIQAENSAEICKDVLETLTGDAASWTAVTTDRCILDTLLSHSPSVDKLYTPRLLEILTRCLCYGEDPEAKITTFITLVKAVDRWNENKSEEMGNFYERIVRDIILPNLIWHAGRSQEALRTISMQCLCNILESGSYSWTPEITPQLIPLLVSLLEDGSKHTRSFSIRTVSFLAIPDQESLIQIYQLLLSRLDDEYDVARIAAVEALGKVFEKLPKDFELKIFQVHFEHLVDTLLVHLDDDDIEIKKELMDVLKIVARINPIHVANKISSMEYLFENKDHYEDFITTITN